jgi:protein SCO1/2
MSGAAMMVLGLLAQTAPEPAIPWIGEVRIDQKLDAQVPLDLVFLDANGTETRFGDVFRGRPAVLALVYHRCPLLCSQVQRGLVMALRAMSLDAGRDFEVIVASIDPEDGPPEAREARAAQTRFYARPGSESGFHFLTGEQGAIAALADSVGFRYRHDPATGQYAHAAGLIVLTPAGRVSRYIYGVDYAAGGTQAAYSPRDLRFALVEAAGGKIGSPVDRVLLLCWSYDPATGRYAIVLDVLRAAAVATVIGLLALIVFLSRRSGTRTGAPTGAEA